MCKFSYLRVLCLCVILEKCVSKLCIYIQKLSFVIIARISQKDINI